MSDSAQGNFPKPGAGGAVKGDAAAQPGGLAAEDADKLAAGFVPSWQFDEAPFAAGAMNPAELEELGASSGVNSDRTMVDPATKPRSEHDDVTAADVDLSGLGGRAAPAAPVAFPSPVAPDLPPPQAAVPASVASGPTLASPGSAVVQPAPAFVQAAPVFAPPPPVVPAPVSSRPKPAVPQRRNGAAAARPQAPPPRYSPDDSDALPIRKSSKGLVIGGVVALAAVAIFVGFRLTHKAPEAPPVQLATAPVTATADPHNIPPPPPATEVATQTAAPPPPPPPAPSPPPVAVAPTPPSRPVAAPPPWRPAPRQYEPARPRPPSTPKSSTKSGGGGIVRDNPF